MSRQRVFSCVLIGLLLASASRVEADEARIDEAGVRLTCEGESVAASGSWRSHAGAIRLSRVEFLEDEPLVAYGVPGDEELWRHTAGPDASFRFLAVAGDDLLLARRTEKRAEGRRTVTHDFTIRRVALDTGALRPPIAFPVDDELWTNQSRTILAALPSGDRLFVLTGPDPERRQGLPEGVSYRVVCLEEGSVSWSREIPARPPGEGRLPGSSRLSRLSLAEDSLIVLPGPRQDLVALDVASGETQFEISKIWEFERTYIIGKRPVYDLARVSEREPGAPGYWPSRVVGGPFIIHGSGGVRMLLPVATAIRSSGRLYDSVLYEITPAGDVRSRTPIPDDLAGASGWSVPGAVLLRGETGALFRIDPAPVDPRTQSATRRGLGEVAWLRRPAVREIAAWMRYGRGGWRDVLFGGRLVQSSTGGFADRQENGKVILPMSVIDPVTGAERHLELELPFKGTLPVPEEGNSSGAIGAAPLLTAASNRDRPAITRLHSHARRLEITVVWTDGSWRTFVFDPAGLLR